MDAYDKNRSAGSVLRERDEKGIMWEIYDIYWSYHQEAL